MNFNEITIGELLVVIAGITAIVSFVTKMTSPFTELRNRMDKVEAHINNDNIRLKALEEDTKMILRATRVLVMHGASNNEKGELKKIQNELDEYLINK